MTRSRTARSVVDDARAFRHKAYALAMLLAPILLIPGTLLNPAVGGIGAGAANIATVHPLERSRADVPAYRQAVGALAAR